MINVIILTSNDKGIASNHLKELLLSKHINVRQVIVSKGKLKKKPRFFKRKILKVFKIGVFGAINGLIMRKWYGNEVQKLHKTNSLKEICDLYSISYDVVEVTNSYQTISLFKNSKADIGISLGNGYINKTIFQIPTYGMLNIHHEILPEYQNAQSVIWQLYNGSKYSGYTIHKINEQIDKGEIVLKGKIKIRFESTLQQTVTKTLFEIEKASALGLRKVLENYDFFASQAEIQVGGNHYTTPSLKQYLKIKKEYKRLKKEVDL